MFELRVFLNIANLLIFFVLFCGCGGDSLIRKEERLVDREPHPLRSELDVRVVSRDEKGFSLFSQIRNIAFVRDSVELKEFYVHGSEEESDVMAFLGAGIGLAGMAWGYRYAKSGSCLYDGVDKVLPGCMFSCFSGLLGAAMVSESGSQGEEFIKVLPGYIKRDTVCVDSISLIRQKIKVEVGNSDFEKVFYTDEHGAIEVKFDEILSDSTVVDSFFNIIIRYYEMADTVEVRRL